MHTVAILTRHKLIGWFALTTSNTKLGYTIRPKIKLFK